MGKNKQAVICIATDKYAKSWQILKQSLIENFSQTDILHYYIGTSPPGTESINITNLYNKASYHDPLGKICSIRPTVVLDAFNKGYTKVIFLGADNEFFSNGDFLFNVLNYHNAFGVPHITNPIAEDGLMPCNASIAKTGHLNSDFVGFYKSEQVINFLKWQEETLKIQCIANNDVFLDQTWLNFLPMFVDNVHILRDETVNVAYYNLMQRNFNKIDGQWCIDRKPLVSFQYSGLDVNNPKKVSVHQNRLTASGDLLEFLELYATKVRI